MISSTQKQIHSSRRVLQTLHSDEKEIKTLAVSGRLFEAKSKAIRVGNQAMAFGVYDVAVTCYKFVHRYHQTYVYSKYHLTKFRKLLDRARKLQQEEEKVVEFYQDIKMGKDRCRTYTESLINLSANYMKQIEEFLLDTRMLHGPFFFHKYYMIKCLDLSLSMKYDKVVVIADEALRFFKNQFLEFTLSQHYFLSVKLDGLISLQKWELCPEVVEQLDRLTIPDGCAKNISILRKARYNLIVGNPVSFVGLKIFENDQDRTAKLLEIYHYLRGAFRFHLFYSLNDLRNDPTGLGISVNIAKLWSAKIEGNISAHFERMEKYKKRHHLDQRSSLMIDYFLKDKNIEEQLRELKWNADIEIIPYEKVIELIESK